MEQFEVETRVECGAGSQCNQKIDVAIDQLATQYSHLISHEAKYDARIAPREPVDDLGRETRGEWIHGTDSNFTGGRVGKKLDLLDALPQFIESGEPVLENRTTIERWLDALPAALEQAYTECMLQIGDGLGHDWMRNCEALGSLRHAA